MLHPDLMRPPTLSPLDRSPHKPPAAPSSCRWPCPQPGHHGAGGFLGRPVGFQVLELAGRSLLVRADPDVDRGVYTLMARSEPPGFAHSLSYKPQDPPLTDAGLARIIAAWPALPEPIRRARLALADSGRTTAP